MLRIRREQLEHFADRSRAEFVEKMRVYLREAFEDRVGDWSDERLRSWLGQALARCERFGVDTEPEAAQLTLLMLVLGLDADERHPWARAALEQRALAPIGKVRLLVREARAAGVDGLEDVLVYDEMAEREPAVEA